MGRTRSTYAGSQKHIKVLFGTSKWERKLERPRRRWEVIQYYNGSYGNRARIWTTFDQIRRGLNGMIL